MFGFLYAVRTLLERNLKQTCVVFFVLFLYFSTKPSGLKNKNGTTKFTATRYLLRLSVLVVFYSAWSVYVCIRGYIKKLSNTYIFRSLIVLNILLPCHPVGVAADQEQAFEVSGTSPRDL